jgi:N4-gp56 family major capsid protein
MTDTAAATGLVVQQWESAYAREYFQGLQGFKPLMGTGENAVIQVKEDLTKKAGDSITIALVNRLNNSAVTGVSTLEGSEEDMVSRSMRIYVDKRRNAVRVPEMAEQRSAISLRNAAKPVLLDWSIEDTRSLLIAALTSINGVAFGTSTEAQRDAWLVDNKDRTVFGAYAKGGSAGGSDFSADTGQLDTSADLFTNVRLDDMIYVAKTCSPKIRPMKDPGNGRRYYVAFAHPAAFQDLRNSIDTEVLALTKIEHEAAKLFEGGDIFWNGCIVKEIDNLPVWLNLGASATTEVTPVYLCGAQALVTAYAKHWRTVTEVFDYGDKHGVAVEAIIGVRKTLFGTGSGDTDDLKDYGVVSGFFATTAAANTADGIAPS